MNIKRLLSMQRSSNTKTTLVAFLVFFISLLGFGLLTLPAQAVGQLIPTMDSAFTGTGLPMVSLTVFIIGIIRVFFALLGVIALILLLYGGFIWMTSQGDPAKVTKAKQIIYNTIIGLIIIFSAFAIATFLMNFLRGVTGGTGGDGGRIPGGPGDFGRSAIGAGPIQSVYPHPNQVNVPINTRIAVTFKTDIIANTICYDTNNNNICDNNESMKNISICEISATSTDAACLVGEFDSPNYVSTTVSQISNTDFKTFVFRTNKHLGQQDELVRIFKVNLGNGIFASSTGKSIFDGYRYDSYDWSFKTNGILDLTPPEVAQFQIVPNPDNEADTYTVDTAATAGSATIAVPGSIVDYHPVLVRNADTGKDIPFINTALENIPVSHIAGTAGVTAAFKLNFNGTIYSSSTVAKEYNMTVSANGTSVTLTNNIPGSAATPGWNDLGVNATTLPIDGRRQISSNAGFSFTATGDLPQNSGWKFRVTPETPINSSSLLVFANGSTTYTFVYVTSSYAYPDVINPKVTQADGTIEAKTFNTITIGNSATITANNTVVALNRVLRTLVTASANTGVVNIVPISAGSNRFSLVGSGSLSGAVTGNLAGINRAVGRTTLPAGSKADPYNNSVFRITFTEAILPINIDNSIIITINGQPVVASTTVTNEYRTIELTGTHDCGVVNSCGKTMYCWLDPNTNIAQSVSSTIEIRSARLSFCLGGTETATQNSWCKNFGGTCDSATNGGRCRLSTGLYYPQAFWASDNATALRGALTGDPEAVSGLNWGMVDMADNSLNGSFDKAETIKGYSTGNAQGRSGAGPGLSGNSTYYANNHMTSNSRGVATFDYEAVTSTGDNFKWSFFISTQIDKSSPLLKTLNPVGDYSLGNVVGENFGQPVKFVFNTLMRINSLKGGYGYGKDRNDSAWNIRYLLLNTITKSANPVGYWPYSSDVDFDQDGFADYTLTNLNHNPFDQSVTYGPLAGSGIESITQNCFLPGNGPQGAGSTTTSAGATINYCDYTAGGNDTNGCVTDSNIPATNRVTSTNPSSYGYMNCVDINGAVKCNGSCRVHYATSVNSLPGSWVISKDNADITDPATGKTGCCYGKCY